MKLFSSASGERTFAVFLNWNDMVGKVTVSIGTWLTSMRSDHIRFVDKSFAGYSPDLGISVEGYTHAHKIYLMLPLDLNYIS